MGIFHDDSEDIQKKDGEGIIGRVGDPLPRKINESDDDDTFPPITKGEMNPERKDKSE